MYDLLIAERMQKVLIIIPKSSSAHVLSNLHELGAMQIDELDPNKFNVSISELNENYKRISEYAQRFRSLEKQLLPLGEHSKIQFNNMDELINMADKIEIDSHVVLIKKQIEKIHAEVKQIHYNIGILEKIYQFQEDLHILNSKFIVSFIVSGSASDSFILSLKNKIHNISHISFPNTGASIISIPRANEHDFGSISSKFNVSIDIIPMLMGKPKAVLERQRADLNILKEREESLDVELKFISEKNYNLVSAIREQLDIEMEKLDVVAKLGSTKYTDMIEGWVPIANIRKLELLLKDSTKNHFIMEKFKTTEIAPTKMSNPIKLKFFEFFVRFYSLPRSDEMDPTLMFALLFPLFFGFMVGDVGYGLIMLAGAFWLIERLKNPKEKSRIPKQITNFVHTIISDNGLMMLSKSIIPGAIIAIIFGIAFNEYFGFQLSYTPLLNVELGLPTLLVISGWIGVLVVSAGFILGAINNIMVGHKTHAIGKIGWLLGAWGIVIFGLDIIHQSPLGISNPIAILSYVLLIVGVGIVAFTEKLSALMELPSLISHMLSYMRLVGILLASVILAQVIDFIFVHSLGQSIFIGIIGVVILILGQLFNIAIALFEPGIQSARLLYVEFFSKFFSGNGKEYAPFKSRRERTLSTFNGEKLNVDNTTTQKAPI